MKQQYLYDVAILRPIAIISLMVYHSFIPFIHGWESQPEGYVDIDIYWWLCKGSFSCLMELFVFISGYVFAFSLKKKGLQLAAIVKNKLKRLYLPCIIFSAIYLLLFSNVREISTYQILISLLEGAGHMWFLPMLFWVTIICFCVYKARINNYSKLIVCFILCVISIVPIPLGLSRAFYYAPFFMIGMLMYDVDDSILLPFVTNKRMIVIWLSFIVLFITGTIIQSNLIPPLSNTDTRLLKSFKLEIQTMIRLLYALIGVFAFFLSAKRLLFVGYKVPLTIVKFNACCFGIYLFHQFILKFVYFYTPLPMILGPYFLPWVGFIIAFLFSWLLTIIFRFTKFGRFIL